MKYRTKEAVLEIRDTPATHEQMETLSSGVNPAVQSRVNRLREVIARATSRLPQFSLFSGTSYMLPSSQVMPDDNVSQELSAMRRELSRENLRQASTRSADHFQSPW